ncbi:hypothetical protein RHMOL_Rhmol01G0271500 [Rhododendron molle]|uniref:Uncharacterized protein n=1 Tax=Rhododendron molle TaxID=49168 RepID=A0ACC0Q7D8_RHOML|nr:hypothetical protein RHMOL_Rhmol01G0271500 [Rhododendron molle]
MDLANQTFFMEGAGHQVLSAFVEIVFDNTDNRIPVDKEEVRLRRTIGLKKDEYFLDGKHITKTEVTNLLESAGFSRSNPYYVVQQGKIASLTLMKDSERLDLLKEIGGTRVYEERRRESLKIMQETGKLSFMMSSFILHYFVSNITSFYQVEEARRKVSEQSTERYNSVLDAHEKSKELDKTFKDLTKEVQILGKEKEAIDKQREEAIKKYTKLELDYEDLKESISGDKRAKDDAVKQLEILQKEIQDSQEELNKIRPLYNNQVREEEEITRGLLSGMHSKMTFSDDCAVWYSIMEREKKLSILYQKRGRATQFANKADRDKWLQREIDEYERVLSSNLTQEEKIKDEIQQLNADIQVQDAYIVHRQTEIADLESVISHYFDTFNQLKSQRDKLQDERKSLWGKESELSGEIDRLKTEVVKAEKNLDHATPGDIRRGLNSVRRICRESGILGVFGPIIELVDCDEKFFTAVEVTAGNSLFHVVVETDEISTQIIRHLNALKGGRVTFIPLNRVKAPQISYPQSSDVIPLLKKLKFKRDYTPAFAQVFGRTVICRDLDVATRVARTDGLDCITLEGDQVSKKGGMTGGFYDYRRSKLKLMNVIKENTNSVNKKEAELEEVRFKLQDIL